MNVRIFTVFIAILISQFANSQQKFEEKLQNLLSQPEYKNASVGIHITSLNSEETIYGLNSEKLRIPASTLKLITSAAALEILGADYRFTTKIGFTGKIKENQLNGNLVVVGGGDPTLGSEYFMDNYFNPHFLEIWAQKIKASGITQIKGNLILDGSFYDSEKIPPTWIWEDMGNYYGAGASALTVYDNQFRITFSSPLKAGKPTKIISIFPEIKDLEITNEVFSSDKNRDLAYVFGSPLDKTRIITGTIPKNRKAYTIKGALQKPEELLAKEIIYYLAKAGVFISGNVQFETISNRKFQIIYIQESPTLSEIVKVLNHKSVNLFAEHLVKQIAAEKNGVGNREDGTKIIKEFWQSKGLDSEFFMEDGSGLSHFNAVSPAQFTTLLKYMFNESSNKESFLNSLPAAGKGTLSGFDSSVFPTNTLKAKSGSMSRVRCYAGYLKTDSGKDLSFSIMFNNFGGSHSKLISEVENLLQEVKTSF